MKKNKIAILCATILTLSVFLGACNKKSNSENTNSNANIASESINNGQEDNKNNDLNRNNEINNKKEEKNDDVENKKTETKDNVKKSSDNANAKNKNTTNNTENPKNEPKKTVTSKSNTNISKDNNTSKNKDTNNTVQKQQPSQKSAETTSQSPKKETKQLPSDSIDYGPAKQLPNKQNMTYNAAFENEIIRLTNELRKQHGLEPLRYDSSLRQSARYKSSAMLQLDYFSHSNPNYNGQGAGYLMLDVFNIQSMMVGENIGLNYSTDASKITAQVRFNSWLNSPPHKEGMLNKDFTRIGVGIVISKTSDGGTKLVGTQHFAK